MVLSRTFLAFSQDLYLLIALGPGNVFLVNALCELPLL